MLCGIGPNLPPSGARRSRQTPGTTSLGARVIVLASTILYVRVLGVMGAVSPAALPMAAEQICGLKSVNASQFRRPMHEHRCSPGQPAGSEPSRVRH